MSFLLVAGTVVSIAKAYSTPALAISDISNAAEAVATFTDASTLNVGDILEVTSAWPGLDKRVVRIKAKATNDVTLEGVDTSSTTLFPAGAGAGSARVVTDWQVLSQLAADVSSSGGEQQYTTLDLLSQSDQVELPTNRTGVKQTLPLYYDPSLTFLPYVRTARDSKTPQAIRMAIPGGSFLYGNPYWSLNEVPKPVNQVWATDIQISYAAQAIVYAS